VFLVRCKQKIFSLQPRKKKIKDQLGQGVGEELRRYYWTNESEIRDADVDRLILVQGTSPHSDSPPASEPDHE
jgi:hypothetical protein